MMEKMGMTVIVEEKSGEMFKVRRVKNRTEPLGTNSVGDRKVVGVMLSRKEIDALISQGVEIIIDPPGYKRRWTP